jgi:hypothetical protein
MAAGETVAVLGPSGSGKSTLLRLVAGLDTPTSGTVLVDGEPVRDMARRAAVVFRDARLMAWRTLASNVAFGLPTGTPRAERRAAVARWLEAVGLDAFGRHRPSQVSGGMAQRAALARALVRRPGVLLWLGIGETPKITLVAIGVFFPAYTTVSAGLEHVDPHLEELGRAYGRRGPALLVQVLIPAAAPAVLSGLRLGLAQGWLFLVAAELIASSMGLGFLLIDSENTVRTDILFLAILLPALLGKTSDAVLGAAEQGFPDAVRDATGGRGVDVVLDPVGGPTRLASLDVLAPFGRVAFYGEAARHPDLNLPLLPLWKNDRSLTGYNIGDVSRRAPDLLRTHGLAALELVASGSVHIDVTDILPLTDAARAHERMQAGHNVGKTLLAV